MQQKQVVSAGEGGLAGNVGGIRSGGGAAAAGSVSVCRPSGSRWTPTPEQLRILKELYYNCGVRSPTAEQIQRIAGMLRQHGKVEGKNVFYWFQNHKARERQKKRLTNLDVVVNTPVVADVHHLGMLSLSSPSSAGTTPPSSTLGTYSANGGASAMQLDTTAAHWDNTAMDTEGCFQLQDYMGVRSTGGGTGVATSPWACFSSSDQRTTTTTRAPETLPLFPVGGGGDDDNRLQPRQGGPAAGGDVSFCWGAAATASTTSTTVTIQQHQLLQMQQQYSFCSSNNTTHHLQLPRHETQRRAAGTGAATLELSLGSWCSPYHAGTM